MNFLSPVFLLLLPLTVVLCRVIPAKKRWMLLLLVSACFYALSEGAASLLLGLIILVTWLCGLGIAGSENRTVRGALLGVSLATCLGSLFTYKYLGALLNALQFGAGRIALPVGISFFTFQTLSYVLDIYRGEGKAERHPGLYALFVCFFPQLVAGPIERASDLLPQLRNPGRVTEEDTRTGLWLMLRGYAKKILLADCAAGFVDAVFSAPGTASAPSAWLAALLFALQIYGDFSGYSDIALGTARLMGVRLSENFRMPYLAHSVREFWRRWHMTLNRWLTDYVYRPLGGSKRGKLRTARNTMIVFLLSGIWHGAGLHFLLWGALHGLALCAERAFLPDMPKGRGERILRTALTFGFVCIAWVFFRAASTSEAFVMVSRMFLGGFALPRLDRLVPLRIAAALAVVWRLDIRLPQAGTRSAALAFFLIGACLMTLMAQAGSGVTNAFIYFRF